MPAPSQLPLPSGLRPLHGAEDGLGRGSAIQRVGNERTTCLRLGPNLGLGIACIILTYQLSCHAFTLARLEKPRVVGGPISMGMFCVNP